MVDAEKPGVEGGSALQALDLTFSIDLCVEEGGGSVELIANGNNCPSPDLSLTAVLSGRDTEVNNINIYQYVRKYAEYRMVTSQEKALKKVHNTCDICLLSLTILFPAEGGSL